MNFKHLIGILFSVLILVNFSCTSYKTVPYFQDIKADSASLSETINNYSPLTIQPGDLLAIHVNSLNTEADAAINYNLERPAGNNTDLSRSAQNAVIGYLVDQEGNIHLPMVGRVKAEGTTTAQLTQTLEVKLSEFLTKPNVNIRIQNFKISVLGDVARPGSFDISNERITVTEALALAGDLTITGVRTNVLLVREKDGIRQYHNFDLTSKNVFNSPYYYLKNNDVIYVKPNNNKVASSDAGYQKASLIVGALSILVYLLAR